MGIKVLYDGWPLIYAINQPSGMHLVELLSHLPEQCEALVVIPKEISSPDWLPEKTKLQVVNTPYTRRAQLNWEQRVLPRTAQESQSDLVHLVTPAAPLLGNVPVVVSPAGYGLGRANTLITRIRFALSQGGMSKVRAVFWPYQLPQVLEGVPIEVLPGLVGPDFNPVDVPDHDRLQGLNLPNSYLLYHGPQDEYTIQRLLAVWSWVASSIGDLFPLVVLGLYNENREDFYKRAQAHNLAQYMKVLPPVSPQMISSIYQGCSGLIHLGECAVWGDPVRYALAYGKPVVGDETRLTDALVGPAGFLHAEADARALGGSLLAIVVEQELAKDLYAKALKQAETWKSGEFRAELLAAYLKVLSQ